MVYSVIQRFSNYSHRTTCGPRGRSLWSLKKKTEEKIKFKWIAFHAITENLRVWNWHMAIAFHFFSEYWYFMKFITPSIYRLHTLLSATKEGFKALCFPCISHAAPVTQTIHNIFSCRPIYDIFNTFTDPQSTHWNGQVLYVVHQ